MKAISRIDVHETEKRRKRDGGDERGKWTVKTKMC